MNTKQIIQTGFFSIIAILGTTACSDSNRDEPEIPAEDVQIDELGYLQNNLVVLDDNGGIKERAYGRVLDESKPETVYVGVENFEEAKEIFASLFADETSITEDGCQAKLATRAGSAKLKADTGRDGLIAIANFDIEGLKHVNTIRFILNSAWPDNYDQNTYHVLGEQYMYNGWKVSKNGILGGIRKPDMNHTFVCIRECRNGVPALLVGFSNYAHDIGGRVAPKEYEKQTSKKQFEEICSILKGNWVYFKMAFNNNGTNLLNENDYFWINADKWRFTKGNLHTGHIKKTDRPKMDRFVFYMLKDN